MSFVYEKFQLGNHKPERKKFRSALRKLVEATGPVNVRYNLVTGSIGIHEMDFTSLENMPNAATLFLTHRKPGETSEMYVPVLVRMVAENVYCVPVDSKIDLGCFGELKKMFEKTHVLHELPDEEIQAFQAMFVPVAMLEAAEKEMQA